MKRIAAFMLGMSLLPLLVILIAIVTHIDARAQSADKPITTWADAWTGVVWDFSMNDKVGCIAGWAPGPDQYSERLLQIAFVDGARLTGDGQSAISQGISQKSIATLIAARNAPVLTTAADGSRQFDPIAQPCYDKLKPPPAPWIVAPSSSGRRPAYILNADGTRGAQSGYANTTWTVGSKTVTMWCECWAARSKETTSSTYCKWASARAGLVTLCKAQPTN